MLLKLQRNNYFHTDSLPEMQVFLTDLNIGNMIMNCIGVEDNIHSNFCWYTYKHIVKKAIKQQKNIYSAMLYAMYISEWNDKKYCQAKKIKTHNLICCHIFIWYLELEREEINKKVWWLFLPCSGSKINSIRQMMTKSVSKVFTVIQGE